MANILHLGFSNTALMYFAAVSIWGFVFYFRKKSITSSFWGALIIAEIIIVVQALIGGYLWIAGARPERGATHLIYGILTPAIIPLIYDFTNRRDDYAVGIIYGSTLLFAVGLIFRAIDTGMFAGY
jgi:heme A synthase